MIWKIIPLFIPVMLVVLLFSACQPASTGSPDKKKSIVVTYSILGSLVRELAGDEAEVMVSIPNGVDPHEWEPSARDIEAINKADLIVRNGLGLEAGLERTLETAASRGVRIFTASDYINIRYVAPGEGIPSGEEQETGAPDPHLWMDPLTVKDAVTALANTLRNELQMEVSQRAVELEKQLEMLNREVEKLLAELSPEDRKLVTGHESMGYFARRYNFKLIGVIVPGLSSQAGVSAADLAALKQAILENRVKAIFTELGTSPAVAQALGDETGVKVVELNTHTLPEDGSYFTFIKNIAFTITEALK